MITLVDKFSSLIDYANDRRDTKYTNLTDIIANELNAEQTPVMHIPSASIEERTQSLIDYANEKCNTSYDNLTDVILNDLKGQRTYSIEEKEPYIYRKTANGLSVGGQKQETIVGGSIVWNQLGNTKDAVVTNYGVTCTGNSNKTSISASGTANTSRYFSMPTTVFIADVQVNHVLLFMASLLSGSYSGNMLIFGNSGNMFTLASPTIKKPSEIANKQLSIQIVADTAYDFEIAVNVIDLTQMFGSEVADGLYAMEQANAGSGVAVFKRLFPNEYYEYNAGELKSVEGLQKHVTTGFNLWDEEWENGSYNYFNGTKIERSNAIRCKNYIPVIPGNSYYVGCASHPTAGDAVILFYDENLKFITNKTGRLNNYVNIPTNVRYITFYIAPETTYKNDICINFNDTSKNGTYEPYKANTYSLDSDIVLRGVPKFANGQIYFDGDTYESDGTVTRKYGIVDLGTLTWSYETNDSYAGSPYFASDVIENFKTGTGNLICSKYVTKKTGRGSIQNMQVAPWNTRTALVIAIRDDSYTDAASFKTAMSGVYLVYELATPTSETADPFTNPQIVSKYGTEEYVTTGLVPVGHDTKYSTD